MFDTTLDPAISQEMVDQAHAADPFDYEQVLAEIEARQAQDDIDEADARGLVAPAIRKPGEAALEARRWHEENLTLGVGMCLATVRHYFNVNALWPDAETAGEHSAPLHRSTNAADFPRGTCGYAYNGRHGHIWINAGGGLCWTTDYRRGGGFVDLAPISAMAPWIGGQLIGWGEVLNGVDVWPTPKPDPKQSAKPVFHAWSLADRRAYVHHRLLRARDDGHDKLAHQLKAWQDKMDAKIEAHK
jgi:hypothetical protein